MVIPLGSGNYFSLRIYIFLNLNLEIFFSLGVGGKFDCFLETKVVW